MRQLTDARGEPRREREHEPDLQKFCRLHCRNAKIDPTGRTARMKADTRDKYERGKEDRGAVDKEGVAPQLRERDRAREEKGTEPEAEAEASLEHDVARDGSVLAREEPQCRRRED